MVIITSLLDTDLYKLTMMQAVFHQFPNIDVEYTFQNRTKNTFFTLKMISEIWKEIEHLQELTLLPKERKYLENHVPFLTKDFLDFLELFRFNPKKYIWFIRNDRKSSFDLKIRGPWLQTILFEVPVLAIINEVYFREKYSQYTSGELEYQSHSNLALKLVQNGEFPFADFGTRRRYSKENQKNVIEYMINNNNLKYPKLIGTSNVYFAMLYNLKPIGTMAHEWIQAGQAITHPMESENYMLQKWVDEYQGNLGIALSDTLGFAFFLKDFNKKFANLYDGVRFDSGDPVQQAQDLYDHYQSLNIDPKTKTIVFSDGLTFEKAQVLYSQFKDQFKVSFGIGTNFTNDLIGTPLQIVIKMTKCNGLHVAKISDTENKTMCTGLDYLKYLKNLIIQKVIS